jgi:hypothetical protein
MITVNGKKYKVVESLGYSPDVGEYAKVILVDGKERTVVGSRGCWRFWVPKILPRSHIIGQ